MSRSEAVSIPRVTPVTPRRESRGSKDRGCAPKPQPALPGDACRASTTRKGAITNVGASNEFSTRTMSLAISPVSTGSLTIRNRWPSGETA